MRLRDGILGGRPAPGEALESERVLAEELGCHRHAAREAVKRLQQAGSSPSPRAAPRACSTGASAAVWTCSRSCH